MTDQNKGSLQQQPNSVKDQVALLSFLDDLIKEKNDPALKPEQVPQVKSALLIELNEMINTHMVRLLPEAEQRQLEAMLDRNCTDEEMDEFFVKKIPNLSAEIASVLVDFRSAYLTPINQPVSGNQPPPPPPAPVADTSSDLPVAPAPVDKVN